MENEKAIDTIAIDEKYKLLVDQPELKMFFDAMTKRIRACYIKEILLLTAQVNGEELSDEAKKGIEDFVNFCFTHFIIYKLAKGIDDAV